LRYRYGDTLYHIAVENPARVSRGVATVEVDGTAMGDKMVILRDDAAPHHVRVMLGSEQTREYVNLASVPELKRDGIRSGP
jgi:hypothetical protein